MYLNECACIYIYICVCMCMHICVCVRGHAYVCGWICERVCLCVCVCLCVWSRWRVDWFGGGIHVCIEIAINAGQLRMMYTAIQNGSAMKQCWDWRSPKGAWHQETGTKRKSDSAGTEGVQKGHDTKRQGHSSGAVWESRWPSRAVRPNEPSGFRGRKATLHHASALVSACP